MNCSIVYEIYRGSVKLTMLRRDRQLDVTYVTGVTGCYILVLHILSLNLLHTSIEYKISGVKTNVFVNFPPPVHSCPIGQIYVNCSNPQVDPELSRERTCENQLLNLTFSGHLPCVSGCVCPPG